MINKLKIEIVKNSLEKVERQIFDSLCKFQPENSLKENKEKAIKLAKSDIVKSHHIGRMYKNKVLKNALLSKSELDALNKGMKIIDEFYTYKSIIEKNKYEILCSPELMEEFLIDCKSEFYVEKAIKTLKKELKNLEGELVKKSLTEQSSSSLEGIPVKSLNQSQKESLNTLGLKYNDDEKITLSKLKKQYYDKIYGVNSYSKDNLNELSNAFLNVKKAFNIPKVS